MTKWDDRFYALAKSVASWSKDLDCRVGAVLVSPNHRQFSLGYNGFPKSIDDCPELLADKELKNSIIVHAEVNAVLNADQSVAGWYLYCTKTPCLSCAKLLVQSNIAKVVCPAPREDSSWYNDNIAALNLLKRAAIKTRFQYDY